MYHVSAQGVDERMINVHHYNYYYHYHYSAAAAGLRSESVSHARRGLTRCRVSHSLRHGSQSGFGVRLNNITY